MSTSKYTFTCVTPSSAETACATEVWKWPLIGQPGVVSETVTSTTPLALTLDRAHHVELDDRAVQLGVDDDLERLCDLFAWARGPLWQTAGPFRARKPDTRPASPPKDLKAGGPAQAASREAAPRAAAA